MAITLTALQKKKTPARINYTWTDLKLDLQYEYTLKNQFNQKYEIVDLVMEHDLGAIKASISNLLNTFPGQKILNPEFGINLYKYLFLPVTDHIAHSIGEDILSQISRFEPRVEVININITPVMDEHEYIIDLSIRSKIDKTSTTLKGVLNQSGFTFNE